MNGLRLAPSRQIVISGKTSPLYRTRLCFGCLFIIAAKEDFKKISKFLLSMPDDLLAETILEIPTFFRLTEYGYIFGVSPDGEIKQFLLDLSMSENEAVSNAAKRALEKTGFGKH